METYCTCPNPYYSDNICPNCGKLYACEICMFELVVTRVYDPIEFKHYGVCLGCKNKLLTKWSGTLSVMDSNEYCRCSIIPIVDDVIIYNKVIYCVYCWHYIKCSMCEKSSQYIANLAVCTNLTKLICVCKNHL